MSKKKAEQAEAPLEISTQSLQVLHQCASQVPANNGQQALLLANALLEVEAVLKERNSPQPAPVEADAV